jgi:hypothetical protein
MIEPQCEGGDRSGDPRAGRASSRSPASRWLAILPGVLAAGAAVLPGGCGKPMVVAQGPEVPGNRPSGRPGHVAVPDAGLDGPGADGFGIPSAPPPALPCGGCGPGQTCQDQTCVDDCRSDRAVPCAVPSLCDFLSGRCVPPEARCVLTGAAAVCGSSEFPPRCGPGSRCDSGRDCVPEAGCRRVVCDASNFCRGADCPQLGGGGVQDVSLEPIGEVAAGAAVSARATVKAEGLCGLSVTFELRKDLELYVSAYNDSGIWRVPLAGPPVRHVIETQPIGGVIADRSGILYYTLQDVGAIRRVSPTAAGVPPVPQPFAALPAGSYGLARMTFGPDGLLYAVAGKQVFRFSAAGAIAQTWTIPESTFLTGIVFDRDGALLVAQHWPTVWRLPPGGTAFEKYLDATPTVPIDTLAPWNEGMTLGPDGLIYVGVFPSGNLDGVVYRIEAMVRPLRLLGLMEMRRDVPETQYAGVHGVAFGNDGTLYFVNQNTATSTREPLGQVLARRPSGRIELHAKGFNFDWPRGYDGDIVVSQATAQSVSAPVDNAGRAQGRLDAPTTPGSYGVRALVTDPRTGAISEARGTVLVR